VDAYLVKSRSPKAYLDGSPATVLTALVLVHVGIQVSTLALAYFHARLTPATAFVLVLLSLLAGLTASYTAPRNSVRLPQNGAAPAWPLAFPTLAVCAYCVLLVRASTLPDYSWDGNTYHIPPLNYWARAGYVHWVNATPIQSELMNGYPKGAELLTWVLATLFRTPRFVSLANFCFLPLGIAGVAQLCELLGTSRRMAWACGSLLMFVPVLLWQCVTSYVDCAFGSTAIAALALSCQVQDEWGSGRTPWRSALALGGAFGLLCAIKSSGLLLTAAGLTGLLVVSVVQARSLTRVPWSSLAGIGVVCAGVGGYWYERNYLHSGNPLFPVGLSFARHALFPGRKISDVLDFAANTPELYRRWPVAVRVGYAWAQGGTCWPTSSGGWDGRFGGLGFLWLAGCVPSILTVATLRLRRLRKDAAQQHDWTLLLLAAVVVAAFLGTPLNWWARYTVWLYGLGLPCVGVLAERLLQRQKFSLPWLWLLAAVGLALYEGGLNLTQIARNADPGDVTLGRAPAVRESAPPGCELFPEAEDTLLQSILLGHESVGLAPLSGDTENGLLPGPLSLPLGARDIIPIPGGSAPDFEALHRHHVRYLIYDGATSLPNFPPAQIRSVEEISGFYVLTLR
jgi:hypothetical protein